MFTFPQIFTATKKEASFFREYARTRPRFKLHVAVDALLALVIVAGTYQFYAVPQRHQRLENMKLSGTVAFTERELIEFVKDEHLVAYWAGPHRDSKYTLIATEPGEVTVSYVPISRAAAGSNQGDLVIQTHINFTPGEAEKYSEEVLGGSNLTVNEGENGGVVHYNFLTPTTAVVVFSKPLSTVSIFDPMPKRSINLASMAGVIRRIS
jgi:hypothetical protein